MDSDSDKNGGDVSCSYSLGGLFLNPGPFQGHNFLPVPDDFVSLSNSTVKCLYFESRMTRRLVKCLLSPRIRCPQDVLKEIRQSKIGVQYFKEISDCKIVRAFDGFLSLSLSLKGDRSGAAVCTEKDVNEQLGVKNIQNEGKDDQQTQNASLKRDSSVLKRDSALNTSKHLLAGAVSAIISRTIVAPLERLKLEYILRGEQKSLFGLIHHITATQGLRGLWKGNFVNLLRTTPFKAINFYAYEVYRKKILEMTGNEEPKNFEKFIAGAAAGITATILCLPMDTIRTKMVAPGGENLGNVISACKHMVQTEGLFSLYKGLLPAIISMAPSGAVFYGVYDILKSSFLHSPQGKKRLQTMKCKGNEFNTFGQLELGPIRTLMYGAIAGAAAEAATYPFEVVRRHLQMQGPQTKQDALKTCIKVVQEGGFTALYAGLVPSMLQVLPSAAISYFVYECMKIILKVE